MELHTVGHGTLGPEDFTHLVRTAGIETILDVRRYPGSRRHPHVGREQMAAWLHDAGLRYVWLPALGGRRRPSPSSPNVGLRNLQFRAYADHMRSEEFLAGIDELLAIAQSAPTAALCSEAVWWRCHRRLLADHLVLLRGDDVRHLMHDGRVTPHPVTPGARVLDGVVACDAA